MIEQYITDLRHADPAVRYAAAQQLGSSGDARALDALIAALPDDNEKVQYAAFSGLIKLGSPQAAAPMLNTLCEARDSRVWALMKLNIGMRLRHGLLDLVPRGDTGIVAFVQSTLDDDTLDVHQRAFFLRALGRAGGAAEVEFLLAALNDYAAEVQAAAGESLGWIGDARAVEPLLALLTDERDALREIAAEALGRIGDARAFDALVTALKTDNSEWVRRAAAVALGALGDERAMDALGKAIRDEDEMVQDAAFESIKQLSNTQYRTVL